MPPSNSSAFRARKINISAAAVRSSICWSFFWSLLPLKSFTHSLYLQRCFFCSVSISFVSSPLWMVAWFPRDSELLKVFLNRVKGYRARLSSDYKIWELMSNWGNWKTSKNKWIVSVSYIFRKCDLLQRHCKLYKWYVVQIVDEIQSRRNWRLCCFWCCRKKKKTKCKTGVSWIWI